MVLQPVLMGYSEQTELNISASSTNNMIHTVVTILYGTNYNLCNSSNHKRGCYNGNITKTKYGKATVHGNWSVGCVRKQHVNINNVDK